RFSQLEVEVEVVIHQNIVQVFRCFWAEVHAEGGRVARENHWDSTVFEHGFKRGIQTRTQTFNVLVHFVIGKNLQCGYRCNRAHGVGIVSAGNKHATRRIRVVKKLHNILPAANNAEWITVSYRLAEHGQVWLDTCDTLVAIETRTETCLHFIEDTYRSILLT